MTTTAAPPRAAETVHDYVQLAARWKAEGRPHRWGTCPCLVCADVRAFMGVKPLAIRIGGYVLPSFRADGSRP